MHASTYAAATTTVSLCMPAGQQCVRDGTQCDSVAVASPLISAIIRIFGLLPHYCHPKRSLLWSFIMGTVPWAVFLYSLRCPSLYSLLFEERLLLLRNDLTNDVRVAVQRFLDCSRATESPSLEAART
jgi:hypothetical protein